MPTETSEPQPDEVAGGLRSSRRGPVVRIRPATVDEMSTVRYIHDNAFKRDAQAHFRDDEIAAFSRHVYAPGYAEAVMADNLHVALLGDDLVGTAGWAGVSDGRATARIKHVFVRPLFTGLGLGHRLVDAMEREAARAGYEVYTLRATLNSVGFFESRGYAISSYGVRTLIHEASLAVAFMRKGTPRPAHRHDQGIY